MECTARWMILGCNKDAAGANISAVLIRRLAW